MPPVESAAESLIPNKSNPIADTEPNLFLQTIQIPKSEKTTDTAPKATPPLPK